MEYTIYNSDGAFVMNVTCSPDSLADMVPDGGFHVEGTQHFLSTCVDGVLSAPTSEQTEEFSSDLNMEIFREQRNQKLTRTDWTQANDSPLSESVKTQWQTYRQQLRDMPQADGFDPLNPTWPTSP